MRNGYESFLTKTQCYKHSAKFRTERNVHANSTTNNKHPLIEQYFNCVLLRPSAAKLF